MDLFPSIDPEATKLSGRSVNICRVVASDAAE